MSALTPVASTPSPQAVTALSTLLNFYYALQATNVMLARPEPSLLTAAQNVDLRIHGVFSFEEEVKLRGLQAFAWSLVKKVYNLRASHQKELTQKVGELKESQDIQRLLETQREAEKEKYQHFRIKVKNFSREMKLIKSRLERRNNRLLAQLSNQQDDYLRLSQEFEDFKLNQTELTKKNQRLETERDDLKRRLDMIAQKLRVSPY